MPLFCLLSFTVILYVHLISSKNNPVVKKCVAPKKAIVKKLKSIQGGGQKMLCWYTCRLKAKILIMTIQVNLCCLLHILLRFGTKFVLFLLLKFIQLSYHHSHFLSATLYFTSFITMAFLGAAQLFYSWAVFGLDFHFSYSVWMLQKLAYCC